MKVSLFVRDKGNTSKYEAAKELSAALSGIGACVCGIFDCSEKVPEGTEVVLSLGGDGTLLSLLPVLDACDIPVLGVNYGRMGFLASVSAEDIMRELSVKDFLVEERTLLRTSLEGIYPYALNELSVHRHGAAMLGVKVCVDDMPLPPYWADGLVVATSSGSTAYSLSIGGPIVFPGSDVFVIAPIAPHNLNVRPLVVPASSRIRLEFISRDNDVLVSLDNRSRLVSRDVSIDVSKAEFPFKLLRYRRDDFINALKGKLFWGYDIRNNE